MYIYIYLYPHIHILIFIHGKRLKCWTIAGLRAYSVGAGTPVLNHLISGFEALRHDETKLAE